MTKISVMIIAKNEEKRIPDCLESVKWADEIIVLDDESTDRTVEIAKSYGAKVEIRKMDNEGAHRNYGYSLAKNDWVLSLDCDERLTPELAEEIQSTVGTDPDATTYSFPQKIFIGKRWIKGAGYYPSCRAKLFRKSTFKYEEAKVHPRSLFVGEGQPKHCQLKNHLMHYSFRDFTDFMNKLNRETGYEVEKWIASGRKVNFLEMTRKATSRFLKMYFQKGGYKDGFIGFIFSFFHSLYQIIAYTKYYEIKHDIAIKD